MGAHAHVCDEFGRAQTPPRIDATPSAVLKGQGAEHGLTFASLQNRGLRMGLRSLFQIARFGVPVTG